MTMPKPIGPVRSRSTRMIPQQSLYIGNYGRAKGALSSHRAVCTFLSNVSIARARTVLREGATLQQLSQMSAGQSTALLAVPLFHVIGCYAHLVSAMASGGKIVLMYKWDANQALELVEREKVNSFTGVPTIVLQALASAQQSGRDLSSLQAIGFSGAPAPPELPSQIGNALPRSIPGNGYGLTESSGLISAVWGATTSAIQAALGIRSQALM